jgi:fructose-bisphosphate aldolase, class I
MNTTELNATARALVAPGKGILAADESTGTMRKRLASINVDSTEENRRTFRELLFTTKDAGEFISGVILYDETIRQSAADGTPFPELLDRLGIIPGIKVDKGTVDMDGLRDRLAEYRELGARFTKWRAVITIGDGLPTDACIDANAEALARYAALSQEAGLVPIVEPEVLMDGDHDIERCGEVTARTLSRVFTVLRRQGVRYDGMLLKPNMVLSGQDSPVQADPGKVAVATVACLRDTVPASVPGIVFLSGGQSDRTATVHLNEINRLGPQPWQLSFSYGRALQAPALQAWRGDQSNGPATQAAFYQRAKLNGTARSGDYRPELEAVA